MYGWMDVCIHICIVRTKTVCKSMYECTHMHVCMYVRMSVCMDVVYVCMYVCGCVYVHVKVDTCIPT